MKYYIGYIICLVLLLILLITAIIINVNYVKPRQNPSKTNPVRLD